jgi:hypothetical protein
VGSALQAGTDPMNEQRVAQLTRRMVLTGAAASVIVGASPATRGQTAEATPWPVAAAAEWQRRYPWLLGSNYVPASAVNQLEMWQAETFDERRIDQELGWAAAVGMNALRVFLHDLPWSQDPAGFQRRIEKFLSIAEGHGIRVLFVLFDSCWDPFPRPGPQPAPLPGVHNSRWVQSPGAAALQDRAQHRRLRAYVEGIVDAFGKDERILAWDLWNEPDNLNPLSYGRSEPPNKLALVLDLLPQVFAWARDLRPVQPLTSGVWGGSGDWSADERLTPIQHVQLSQSDVISFHHYAWPEDFALRVGWLQRYGRPVLCTEYMARPLGSTFDQILPLAKELGVAAFNWGLVAGRTQTWLPWNSWQHPYVGVEPDVWFHDVFRPDGTPYRRREIEILQRLSVR